MVEIRRLLGLGKETFPIVEHPTTPKAPEIEGVVVHPGEDYELANPVVDGKEILVENSGGKISTQELKRIEKTASGSSEDSRTWWAKVMRREQKKAA